MDCQIGGVDQVIRKSLFLYRTECQKLGIKHYLVCSTYFVNGGTPVVRCEEWGKIGERSRLLHHFVVQNGRYVVENELIVNAR